MLYPIDSTGQVLNEADPLKVQNEYQPMLEEVTEICQRLLGDTLRSLILRGSVSVGRAKPNLSDVDLVAIVTEPLTKEHFQEIQNEVRALEQTYTFIPFVDVTAITLNQLLTDSQYVNLPIYLKTQSFALAGKSILSELPDVYPGPDLALSMYKNLDEELATLHAIFAGANTERTYQGEHKPNTFWCVWTMRTLLRSGLGLVMMEKPVYSQDLVTCYEVFAERYPEFSKPMHLALHYSIEPTNDAKKLLSYLDDFVPQYRKLWHTARTAYDKKI